MNNKTDLVVKDWYIQEYPDDELGVEIKDKITFEDLHKALQNGDDVYEFLGDVDSIVRERCFDKLAQLLGKDYDYIYRLWLDNGDSDFMNEHIVKKSLKESTELDRQAFVSLVKLGDKSYDGYSILNDGNFVKRLYADSDEDAISQFRDWIGRGGTRLKESAKLTEDTSYTRQQLIDAVKNAYGFTNKEALAWIKKASDEAKREVVNGFRQNARKNFYDESLKESKTLTERAWRYELKNGSKLRRAIQSGDYEDIRQALIDCYDELLDKGFIDEYDHDDWTEEVRDYEFESDDDVDFELEQLYDLCDNIDVFVALDSDDEDISWNFKESLKEDWYHFEYESGANPYIAKSERERDRIIRKYQDRVEDLGNGNYIIHDKEEDLFSIKEDTVKQGNAWVNKGKEGTHGKFKTKKAADAQRKAMFANSGKNRNFGENLKEDYKEIKRYVTKDGRELNLPVRFSIDINELNDKYDCNIEFGDKLSYDYDQVMKGIDKYIVDKYACSAKFQILFWDGEVHVYIDDWDAKCLEDIDAFIEDGQPYSAKDNGEKYFFGRRLAETKNISREEYIDIALKYKDGYKYAVIQYFDNGNPNNYVIWFNTYEDAKNYWRDACRGTTYAHNINKKIRTVIDLTSGEDITKDVWYDLDTHSNNIYFDPRKQKRVCYDFDEASKLAKKMGAEVGLYGDDIPTQGKSEIAWYKQDSQGQWYCAVLFVGDGKLKDVAPEFAQKKIFGKLADNSVYTYYKPTANESLKESVDDTKALIDFLKSLKLDDEVEEKVIGDWTVNAWTTEPRLNFSRGFYIVQIDNDKLNKHFSISDCISQEELEYKRDRVIKDRLGKSLKEELTEEILKTPRGDFKIYKGTWRDFKNEADFDDWGFWFDHSIPEDAVYSDLEKWYKIMHNHKNNNAIAVLYKDFTNKGLKEGYFDTDFDNKKVRRDIIGWWDDVERWNEENGSPYSIDNGDTTNLTEEDVEDMLAAMFDMLRELKDVDKDLYKKGRRIYNKYAITQLREGKKLRESVEDNYVIFTEFDDIKGTPEDNYNAQIRNANKVINFSDDGFDSIEQVVDYVKKYFKVKGDVIVKDKQEESLKESKEEDLTADEIAYKKYQDGEYTYQDYVDVCTQEECEPLPEIKESIEEGIDPVSSMIAKKWAIDDASAKKSKMSFEQFEEANASSNIDKNYLKSAYEIYINEFDRFEKEIVPIINDVLDNYVAYDGFGRLIARYFDDKSWSLQLDLSRDSRDKRVTGNYDGVRVNGNYDEFGKYTDGLTEYNGYHTFSDAYSLFKKFNLLDGERLELECYTGQYTETCCSKPKSESYKNTKSLALGLNAGVDIESLPGVPQSLVDKYESEDIMIYVDHHNKTWGIELSDYTSPKDITRDERLYIKRTLGSMLPGYKYDRNFSGISLPSEKTANESLEEAKDGKFYAYMILDDKFDEIDTPVDSEFEAKGLHTMDDIKEYVKKTYPNAKRIVKTCYTFDNKQMKECEDEFEIINLDDAKVEEKKETAKDRVLAKKAKLKESNCSEPEEKPEFLHKGDWVWDDVACDWYDNNSGDYHLELVHNSELPLGDSDEDIQAVFGLKESADWTSDEILAIVDKLNADGIATTTNKGIADAYAANENPYRRFEVSKADDKDEWTIKVVWKDDTFESDDVVEESLENIPTITNLFGNYDN